MEEAPKKVNATYMIEELHSSNIREAVPNNSEATESTLSNIISENTKYTSYVIKSPLFEGVIKRRYRDFYAFRTKLVQKYPGVYVANIPPKVYINNRSKQTIKLRLRILQNFCVEISKVPALKESEEFIAFFSPWELEDLVGEKIKVLPDNLSYDALLSYYRRHLDIKEPEKDNIFVLTITDIEKYLDQVNHLFELISNSKDKVKQIVESDLTQIKIESKIFQHMNTYEEQVLFENINKDTSKLVFFNPQNSTLHLKAVNYKNNTTPPNKIVLEFLEDKELDLLAMKDMLNGYLKLINTYNEFKMERDKLSIKIEDASQGKRNLIEIITFQEPSDIFNETTKRFNQVKEDIKSIAEILSLLSPNVKHVMDEYVDVIRRSFYEMLRSYIAEGITLFKKKKDFWNEAKSIKTGEVNQKDNLSKD